MMRHGGGLEGKERTIRYRFLDSTRTMISLHNTMVNFRPDFDFVTEPSFNSFRGPWYAVGAVKSNRLVVSIGHITKLSDLDGKCSGERTYPSPPIHRSSLNTLNLSSPSASLTLSLIAPVIPSASFNALWTVAMSWSGEV